MLVVCQDCGETRESTVDLACRNCAALAVRLCRRCGNRLEGPGKCRNCEELAARRLLSVLAENVGAGDGRGSARILRAAIDWVGAARATKGALRSGMNELRGQLLQARGPELSELRGRVKMLTRALELANDNVSGLRAELDRVTREKAAALRALKEPMPR